MKWSQFFTRQRCNYPCESVFSNPENVQIAKDAIASTSPVVPNIDALTRRVEQLAAQIADQRHLFKTTLDKCFGDFSGNVAYYELDGGKLPTNLTNGYAIQVLSLKQANASLERLNEQSTHLAATIRARNRDLQANYFAVEGHNQQLLAEIERLKKRKPRKG